MNLERLVDELLQSGSGQLYDKMTEALDRTILPRVLRHTRGNQTQASELLGLHRSTLRHKLKALELAVDRTLIDEATRDDS
jgi:two-component system nitrogen regulation response regulator GlnG